MKIEQENKFTQTQNNKNNQNNTVVENKDSKILDSKENKDAKVNKITEKKSKLFAKKILNLLGNAGNDLEKYEDAWLSEMKQIYKSYGAEGMTFVSNEVRDMLDKILHESLGVNLNMFESIADSVTMKQNSDNGSEDKEFIKALPSPF